MYLHAVSHVPSQLYEATCPDTAIAWFVPSRKRVLGGSGTPSRAYLALQPKAELIRDDVVVSFLIVEESTRMQAMRRGMRW